MRIKREYCIQFSWVELEIHQSIKYIALLQSCAAMEQSKERTFITGFTMQLGRRNCKDSDQHHVSYPMTTLLLLFTLLYLNYIFQPPRGFQHLSCKTGLPFSVPRHLLTRPLLKYEKTFIYCIFSFPYYLFLSIRLWRISEEYVFTFNVQGEELFAMQKESVDSGVRRNSSVDLSEIRTLELFPLQPERRGWFSLPEQWFCFCLG